MFRWESIWCVLSEMYGMEWLVTTRFSIHHISHWLPLSRLSIFIMSSYCTWTWQIFRENNGKITVIFHLSHIFKLSPHTYICRKKHAFFVRENNFSLKFSFGEKKNNWYRIVLKHASVACWKQFSMINVVRYLRRRLQYRILFCFYRRYERLNEN